MKFEVFFGNGGHAGPFHSLKEAREYGIKYLFGCESETLVMIRERTKDAPGGYGTVHQRLIKREKPDRSDIVAENEEFEISMSLW